MRSKYQPDEKNDMSSLIRRSTHHPDLGRIQHQGLPLRGLGTSYSPSCYAALAGWLGHSRFTELARFGFLALILALRPITVALPGEINPALLYDQAMLLEPKFEPEDSQYVFGTDWRGRA